MSRKLSLTLVLTASLTLAQEKAATPEAAEQKIDFQTLTAGPVPDESFMSTDQEAKFRILADGDNKVLELQPQPIVDGGMLVGKSVKGACTITAKIKATGKRRTQPRFGAGVHGVSGPRLRVVPARKLIEIVTAKENEEAVATAPYAWKSGTWTWVELSVKPAASGATLEGRVWEDGQPRPEKPTVTWKSPDPPGQGRASVWGTPYSELPVWFDDVTIR